METKVFALLTKDGRVILSKLEELTGDIGEPDYAMIDPVLYDESEEDLSKAFRRFPGTHITENTRVTFHSDSLFSIVEPINKLLAEYLVFIAD